MKKHLFAICLLLCFHSSMELKAQHRYLADNPVWTVNTACDPYPCISNTGTIYYYLNGDTILGNYRYHKVFKKVASEYVCYSGTTHFGTNDSIHPVAYIRDTLKQIRQWNNFFNVDTLLYNFNLHVGDTVPNTAYGITTVASIDSFPVSNYFRKRFILSNPNCSQYLYEGIGNINGFLEPVICANVSSPVGYTLSCYGFHDTTWFPTINTAAQCVPPIILGVTEYKQNLRSAEITVFPNPSSSIFHVNAIGYKIEKIKITDVIGELLFQKDSFISNPEIDISGYFKGIYIVEIYTEKGIVGKKIVKE